MLKFFVILYYSIFRGSWQANVLSDYTLNYGISKVWANISRFIMATLGGNFTSTADTTNILYIDFPVEVTSSATEFPFLLSTVLATITMLGLCFAVCKLVKSIFNIFFAGWR